MKPFRDCPKVLYQKVIFTGVIGLGCLLVGGAYFLFTGDDTTLMLSTLIMAFSLWRAVTLYRTVCGEHYEVVEGTCVGVKHRPMRKHFTVKVMDDAGLETSLRLGKGARVKIGFRYRFYFTKVEKVSLGSEYLDTALSQGSFLGYEDLGDVMEAKVPAAGEGAQLDAPAQEQDPG